MDYFIFKISLDMLLLSGIYFNYKKSTNTEDNECVWNQLELTHDYIFAVIK